jgi:YggT family protein
MRLSSHAQEIYEMLYSMVSMLLEVVASVLAGACLLRLAMHWLGLPMNRQPGLFVTALTDWIVRPLRRVVPMGGRADAASLLAAWIIKLVQLVLLWLAMGGPMASWMLVPASLVALVQLVVSALSALVLVYAILSWVQPGSYLHHTAARLCEPWLYPLQRILPRVGGADLSPLALLLLLQMVGIMLAGLMRSLLF